MATESSKHNNIIFNFQGTHPQLMKCLWSREKQCHSRCALKRGFACEMFTMIKHRNTALMWVSSSLHRSTSWKILSLRSETVDDIEYVMSPGCDYYATAPSSLTTTTTTFSCLLLTNSATVKTSECIAPLYTHVSTWSAIMLVAFMSKHLSKCFWRVVNIKFEMNDHIMSVNWWVCIYSIIKASCTTGPQSPLNGRTFWQRSAVEGDIKVRMIEETKR